MSIDEVLISRLSSEAGQRMVNKARTGRTRALQLISRYVVTLTRDGNRSWEEIFDRPPTIAELAARVGPDVFIANIRMQRKSLRERIKIALAA